MEINKIYNEDCIETMKRMPNNFIDLTVTSPPYNMRLRVCKNGYVKRTEQKHFSKKYKHFDDAIPINDFYQFHSKVLTELIRTSKLICYNFQIVTGSKWAFFKMIGDFNDYIKDIIIWDKGFGQPAMSRNVLNSCYEMILILENDKTPGRLIKNSTFKRGEMDNILRIGRGKKISEIHSATFPEKLVSELINMFSKEGDLIYDPFMGSGTTAKVAILSNRRYMGSEISEEYCKIAEERINQTIHKQIKLEDLF
jgi:site-specific DNA-methyltransferase (adenine-specific)